MQPRLRAHVSCIAQDLATRPPPWNETVDKVREYWNKRPCNLKHSDKPIGTKEYFDEVEIKKYRVEPHIPGFARFEVRCLTQRRAQCKRRTGPGFRRPLMISF